MGAKDSVLTGSAGEHYVLYELQRRGLLASLSPPNAYAADILVFSPNMTVGSMVQVKTRTTGRDQGWHMRDKHERLVHPRLFYAFLDLEPDDPVTYVLPSAVAADVLTRTHRAWLAATGAHGQPHHDHPMRRLLPVYPNPVPEFPDGWLEQYRERWNYLTKESSVDAG